jgi:hypothetical protein
MDQETFTTVRVRQDTHADLDRLARELSRRERRRVTLGEVVSVLLRSREAQGGNGGSGVTTV